MLGPKSLSSSVLNNNNNSQQQRQLQRRRRRVQSTGSLQSLSSQCRWDSSSNYTDHSKVASSLMMNDDSGVDTTTTTTTIANSNIKRSNSFDTLLKLPKRNRSTTNIFDTIATKGAASQALAAVLLDNKVDDDKQDILSQWQQKDEEAEMKASKIKVNSKSNNNNSATVTTEELSKGADDFLSQWFATEVSVSQTEDETETTDSDDDFLAQWHAEAAIAA